jgi:integrase
MKKPRYVNIRKARYYWEPTPTMREAGFSNESLGPVGEEFDAFSRAEELNRQWDEIAKLPRNQKKDIKSIAGLIRQFQHDPSWYGNKAPRTQDEIDYAFKIIGEQFGKFPVANLKRRHCIFFYNILRVDDPERDYHGSAHKARKVLKWFRRLFRYAQELELREDNPASGMQMETPGSRDQVWHPSEVIAIIEQSLSGGVADSGNRIPPRPSIALAIQIAYDTSLPQQDILDLKWGQYDGEALTVKQKKKRGNKQLYLPMSELTIGMIEAATKDGMFIVTSEKTGKPYNGRSDFGRLFRKFKQRAGVTRDITFQDLRTSMLTELGNAGATEAEIVSFSGHKMGSRVLDDYVKPDHRAAKRARAKLTASGAESEPSRNSELFIPKNSVSD